jgi:hypothetical protein
MLRPMLEKKRTSEQKEQTQRKQKNDNKRAAQSAQCCGATINLLIASLHVQRLLSSGASRHSRCCSFCVRDTDNLANFSKKTFVSSSVNGRMAGQGKEGGG